MSIPHQTADDPADAAYSGNGDMWTETRQTPSSGDRVRPGGRPEDEDAEQSVLGSMLLSQDAIEAVASDVKLKGRDFYHPKHEIVFDAILGMYAAGEPVDPITTAATLQKAGNTARAGGPGYLHTLVSAVPTAANASYYAEIVKEHAGKRRLIEAGTKIVQMGFADGELADAVDAAGAEIFQVTDASTDVDYAPIGANVDEEIDYIEQLGRQSGDLIGLPTGFTDLNALIGGFQPEQFIILAARPAMGKSTLALDFLRACSLKNSIPTALFSLEMGSREITHRLLSATGKVALHHIRNGQMADQDWDALARIVPAVKQAPLFRDVSANLSLMDIRTKARRLVQQEGVRMIVVDYIQLMRTGSRSKENRQEEVSEISRGLKLLAKELGVPVIGLSQLNRGPEQRTDKKPQVSDLRESGSLEQDADIVILLHREDHYDKESSRAGEADLIVAKHRNGPTATITVAFQGHYSRFTDMAQM